MIKLKTFVIILITKVFFRRCKIQNDFSILDFGLLRGY